MSLTHSPVARRSTSFHASSMTSIDRPANSRRRSVSCSAFGAALLDPLGDVLGEHEQHRRRQLARDLARVEGDQRRVGGDGGVAVEQVGVGAVARRTTRAARRACAGPRRPPRRRPGLRRSARRRSSSQQQPLARDDPLAGGARVDGADRDLQQVALERVEAVGVLAGAVVADQQRVQRDEVGDLLDRRARRVLDVPRVDGVLVGGGADPTAPAVETISISSTTRATPATAAARGASWRPPSAAPAACGAGAPIRSSPPSLRRPGAAVHATRPRLRPAAPGCGAGGRRPDRRSRARIRSGRPAARWCRVRASR